VTRYSWEFQCAPVSGPLYSMEFYGLSDCSRSPRIASNCKHAAPTDSAGSAGTFHQEQYTLHALHSTNSRALRVLGPRSPRSLRSFSHLQCGDTHVSSPQFPGARLNGCPSPARSAAPIGRPWQDLLEPNSVLVAISIAPAGGPILRPGSQEPPTKCPCPIRSVSSAFAAIELSPGAPKGRLPQAFSDPGR
jgi:hypothetical protein